MRVSQGSFWEVPEGQFTRGLRGLNIEVFAPLVLCVLCSREAFTRCEPSVPGTSKAPTRRVRDLP